MTKIIHLVSLSFLVFSYTPAAGQQIRDRYYPRYHLAPPSGWMNDPNGFSIYKGHYHLFYQYNPLSSQEPGIAHWGHAKSLDLFHWQHLPIAMYPDKDYDRSGVFSGSAIVEDDTMYLFYTGNVNHPGSMPDHEQHQCLATSTDGVTVTKYVDNPIINGAEHQPNIRDPKVWKHGDTYYMVLGNSFNNDTRGRALLYASQNKVDWWQASVLDESDGSTGYMWECPDFFELSGRHVLLFSPQGLMPQGDKYLNLYQTGYVIGDFDYQSNMFTPLTEFKELDHGHDFYATQTILDSSDRRIMIAWFDMWEQNYPERNDGFTGYMTIPRVLTMKEGRLYQKPVKEVSKIRGMILRAGAGAPGTSVDLLNKAAEIRITAEKEKDFELVIEGENASVILSYSYEKGTVTLDRGGLDGRRRTKWRPKGKLQWTVFVDASSVELFCGEGEITFSSRFFPEGEIKARLGNKSNATDFKVFGLRRTVPLPSA